MKKTIVRILLSLVAISVGAALMYLLALAGKESKGPINNAFEAISEASVNIESKLLMEYRENSRRNELAWFSESQQSRKQLLHPSKLLLGAHDNDMSNSLKCIIDLEDTLNTSFPLIHIYNAWGSAPENQFPSQMVQAISALGSVPLITWEPWLNGFTSAEYNKLPAMSARNSHGMADVSKGLYDKYIIAWAQKLKEFNSNVFLRLGHEMNDPYRYPWGPQNNSAAEFVGAWKHVHAIFQKLGVKNVIWVWNPHPAYGFFDEYYPGDKYVDYVGTSVLNFGTAATWSQWWSFDEMFGQHYLALAKYKKPIMISELGSLSEGGSKEKWYRDALNKIETRYPAIKAILFYHVSNDNTSNSQTFSWYFINDKNTVRTINKYLPR